MWFSPTHCTQVTFCCVVLDYTWDITIFTNVGQLVIHIHCMYNTVPGVEAVNVPLSFKGPGSEVEERLWLLSTVGHSMGTLRR